MSLNWYDDISYRSSSSSFSFDGSSETSIHGNVMGSAAALLANATLSPDEKIIIDEFFTGSIFDQITETIIIIVFTILIVTGFLFNSLMIIVILLSEKLRRMPFNLLLLNLCVSNILLSIFCMPFSLLGLIRRGWLFGPALCKIIPSLQGVGVCVSATTVTVIACDRYFSIVYQDRRTRQRIHSSTAAHNTMDRSQYYQVAIETVIIWVIGIVSGLPVSVFQIVITFPQYSDRYIQCIEDWPKTLKSAYSVTILLVQCVLPSVALVITGSAITSHLNKVAGLLSGNSANTITNTAAAVRNSLTITVTAPPESQSSRRCVSQQGVSSTSHVLALDDMSQGNRVTGSTSSASATNAASAPTTTSSADYHQRNVERNQSVTRTLLAVSISFTLCWMPLHILNALIDLGFVTHEQYTEHVIYLMIAICSSIAMTSVPLNALLYGWYNPSINREVITWRLSSKASPPPSNSSQSHNNNDTRNAAATSRQTSDFPVNDGSERSANQTRGARSVNSSSVSASRLAESASVESI